MKKLLLGTFLIALAAPAVAADMPVKARPLAVNPAVSWSGFDIGASVGYLTGALNGDFINAPFGTWQIDHQAGVLDGHVGAQYQFANIVLGVEGDFINFFDKTGSRDTCHPIGACGLGFTQNGHLVDHMWTAGGRAGLVVGSSMYYVSGGYAGNVKFENDFFTGAGALGEFTTTTHTGTYIGGGFDWMVTQNWIVGAEYRHYEFGSQTAIPITPAGVSVPFDTWTLKAKADTISVRLSWLFGWAGASMMSRY